LLVIDTAETPVKRIKKNKKVLYSGKKKQHTLKSQIVINLPEKTHFINRIYIRKSS
jgi:hypothetical protein